MYATVMQGGGGGGAAKVWLCYGSRERRKGLVLVLC